MTETYKATAKDIENYATYAKDFQGDEADNFVVWYKSQNKLNPQKHINLVISGELSSILETVLCQARKEGKLDKIRFQRTIFTGHFQDITFDGTNLEGAFFTKAGLEDLSFKGANLSHAIFKETSARRADFSFASLKETSARMTDFAETIFVAANCTSANFRASYLYRSNFSKAVLDNTNFYDAYLLDTKLKAAKINESTAASFTTKPLTGATVTPGDKAITETSTEAGQSWLKYWQTQPAQSPFEFWKKGDKKEVEKRATQQSKTLKKLDVKEESLQK